MKMVLQEVRCSGLGWIDLAQDNDMGVNEVLTIRVP